MSGLKARQQLFEEAGVYSFTPEEWLAFFHELGVSSDMDHLVESYLGSLGTEENVAVADLLRDLQEIEDIRAFLRMMGVSQPSEQDIDYARKTHLLDVVSNYTKTMLREKPYTDDTNSLNQFSADYFSGKLASMKRLVLISSSVKGHDDFKAAVRASCSMGSEIITSTFNFEASPSQIQNHVQNLVAEHGVFKTVALASCGGNMAHSRKWHLTANASMCPETWEMDEGINDLFQALANAASVRLDLLVCDFATSEDVLKNLRKWEQETKTNVAASTDLTGNAAEGGDMILETDDIDLADIYFDRNKLRSWHGTFGDGSCSATENCFFVSELQEKIDLSWEIPTGKKGTAKVVGPYVLNPAMNNKGTGKTTVPENWNFLEKHFPLLNGKKQRMHCKAKQTYKVSLQHGKPTLTGPI